MKTLKAFLGETTIRLNGPTQDQKDRVNAFMKDYHETTTPHPWDNHTRIFGKVKLEVSPSVYHGGVHISDIQSMDQGSGAGTTALRHLTSLADKHGVSLDLFPHGYANTTDEQLHRWYGRHDFESKPDHYELLQRHPR